MGYTHYFEHKGDLDREAKAGWKAALPAIRDILSRHADILRYECDQLSVPPMLNEQMFTVRLNGKGEDGHETFSVDLADHEFQFCKTARKPYDLPVCEILLVLAHHLPGLRVSSDGFDALGGLEEGNCGCNWPKAAKEVEERYGIKMRIGRKGGSLRLVRADGFVWRCPKCGSTRLQVQVTAWAELVQAGDGTFETDTDGDVTDHDHEFDDESTIACLKCEGQFRAGECRAKDEARRG